MPLTKRLTRSRRGAEERERGAVLVETAFVAPVLLLLLLGCLEFGLVFRDYLTVGDAASDSARLGAIQGPKTAVGTGANANFEIVKRLREATAGIPVESIERIVIFKAGPGSAGSAEDQVPGACLSGGTGVTGVCTVYTDPTATFLAVQSGDVAYFACNTNCWDPNTWNDGPNPSNMDYVGVYVEVERQLTTGLFGDAYTITAASISRLEPGVIE